MLNERKAELSCGEARGKVKGGLFHCRSFWEDCLAASPFVSSIVNEGYSLPFAQLPPALFLRNNRSAFRNSEFVGAAILELLEQDLIIEVNSPPHCVNPLSVAEGKKLRLVLDLCEVNMQIFSQMFFSLRRSSIPSRGVPEGILVFYMGPKIRVSPRGHLPPVSTISGFLVVNSRFYTIFLFFSTPVRP